MADSLISQFRREYNSPIETDRQVNTIAQRDAISTLRRWEGMLVYVITDGITYELRGGTDNTFWEPMIGIGDAPEDGESYVRRDGSWELASSGIPEAPEDGELYGRIDGAWGIVPEALAQSEGTWTPNIIDIGTGATYTFTVASANYVKVGRMVMINCEINFIDTVGTPTGRCAIDGLPFECSAGASMAISRLVGTTATGTFYQVCIGSDSGGTSSLNIKFKTSSSSPDISQSAIPLTFTNGFLSFSGVYYTDET